MLRCLSVSLLHCHADCYSAPRARAGSHRASSQASRTPSASLRSFAISAGRLTPKPPPIPEAPATLWP